VRGEPTAKFTADAFEGDRNIPETVETASATVHVYEFGVVPRLKQSWAGEHEGQEATVDVDIDYRDPGVTVAEPDWAEEARGNERLTPGHVPTDSGRNNGRSPPLRR